MELPARQRGLSDTDPSVHEADRRRRQPTGGPDQHTQRQCGAMAGPKSINDESESGEGPDRDELTAALEELRPKLVRWARRRMGERVRAVMEPEDVVQEVLLVFARNPDRVAWRDARQFLAWASKVGERVILQAVARQRAPKRDGAHVEGTYEVLAAVESDDADPGRGRCRGGAAGHASERRSPAFPSISG